MNNSLFDPLGIWRAPWSGDVSQRISAPWFSPALTVNYAGDRAIEDRVVTEVASYGRQLGWLNEIVLALASGRPVPAETLQQLQDAVTAIAQIKQRQQVPALEAAQQALDRLARDNPDQYEALLRSRQPTSAGTPAASAGAAGEPAPGSTRPPRFPRKGTP